MCDQCFVEQITAFHSNKEFEEFETLLDNLVLNNKIDKTGINKLSNNINIESFKCKFCNENWILSIPDNRPGGFFMTSKDAIALIERRKKINQIIFVVFIVILISVLFFIFE